MIGITLQQKIFTCPWAWKSVSHLENTKAFMAIAATWSELLLVTPGPSHVQTSLLEFPLLRENIKKGLFCYLQNIQMSVRWLQRNKKKLQIRIHTYILQKTEIAWWEDPLQVGNLQEGVRGVDWHPETNLWGKHFKLQN